MAKGKFPRMLTGTAGFFDGIREEAGLDALARGSKNMHFDGQGKLVAYGGWVTRTTGDFSRIAPGSSGYAFLVGGVPAVVSGRGLAAAYRNGLVVFCGEATADVDWGAAALDCSLVPQLYGLDIVGPLGLPVPPQIVDSGAIAPTDWEAQVNSGGGLLMGTVTLKAATYREETRGQSWTSKASDYLVATGSSTIDLVLPDLSASYPGTIKYKVYSSLQGFPEGPHYLLGTYAAGTHVLSYTDADLVPVEAPFSQDTATLQTPTGAAGKYGLPPQAAYVVVMGPHVVLIACWDAPNGHLIHPSQAFKMESFDPDAPVLANPAEPILGVVESMSDGYLLLVHKNGISAIVLSGSNLNPVIPRNIYYGIGANSANQVCTVAGEIYLWNKRKGLVRTGNNGDVDAFFTAPVRRFLAGFTGNPVIGYDPATDRIVVAGSHSNPFGSGAANCFIAYERGLPGDIWSAPSPLPSTPVTRVTYDGQLYLLSSAAGFIELFPTSGGAGAGDGIAQFHPQDGGATGHLKNVTKFLVSASGSDADVVITTGHDHDTAATHNGVAISDGSSEWVETLALMCRSFSGKVTVGAGESFNYLALEYTVDDRRT